jgi:hypothetical protein
MSCSLKSRELFLRRSWLATAASAAAATAKAEQAAQPVCCLGGEMRLMPPAGRRPQVGAAVFILRLGDGAHSAA